MERYARNGILTDQEQAQLWTKKILIVGSGGLGGYIFEMLTRVGIGSISVVDGDVFEGSNLNRQLLSTADNIGESKARAAVLRGKAINPAVHVGAVARNLTADNASELVEGHDLVFDALDSVPDRFVLFEACKLHRVPMVHGAIAGWLGQVAFIKPEDQTLHLIYPTHETKGNEVITGNPSFTPAVVAGIQVAEGIKFLTHKETLADRQILSIDLLTHQYAIVDL